MASSTVDGEKGAVVGEKVAVGGEKGSLEKRLGRSLWDDNGWSEGSKQQQISGLEGNATKLTRQNVRTSELMARKGGTVESTNTSSFRLWLRRCNKKLGIKK